MLVVVAHIKAPATTQTLLWNVKAASSQPPWEAPRCQVKAYFPSTLLFFFPRRYLPLLTSQLFLFFFFLSFTKAIFLPLRPRFVSWLLRFQNKPEKTWVIIFVRKHTLSAWQIKRQDFANHRYFQCGAAGAFLLPKYRRAMLSDSLQRGRQ